jgi:hypothetical protein
VIVEVMLALAAMSAAGGAASLLARRRRARTSDGTTELGRALTTGKKVQRGLKDGDVLLVVGEELALGSTLEIDEAGLVLRGLRTIGRASASWVLHLDPDAQDIVLANETAELGEGRVPDALLIGGRTLTLKRRGRGRVRASGPDVPAADGKSAAYVVLAERGGKVAIAIDVDGLPRIALVGELVDRRTVDLLPGGDVERTR